MTDDTKPADTQQQPAGVGAPPDITAATVKYDPSTALAGQRLVSDGAAAGPSSLKRDLSLDEQPSQFKGPRDWEEMKAWIRRELTLAGEGHTAEERDALNP